MGDPQFFADRQIIQKGKEQGPRVHADDDAPHLPAGAENIYRQIGYRRRPNLIEKGLFNQPHPDQYPLKGDGKIMKEKIGPEQPQIKRRRIGGNKKIRQRIGKKIDARADGDPVQKGKEDDPFQ